MKTSSTTCIKFFCWYGFKCEGFIDVEAGVPGKNPRAQAGDHHTLSQSTTVEQMDRTRVVAVLRDYFVHCATWTPNHNRSHANQALVKVT